LNYKRVAQADEGLPGLKRQRGRKFSEVGVHWHTYLLSYLAALRSIVPVLDQLTHLIMLIDGYDHDLLALSSAFDVHDLVTMILSCSFADLTVLLLRSSVPDRLTCHLS
jgi:hypothetical protein